MINSEGRGRTYLISIAIGAYRSFEKLENAVKDSEDLVQTLTEKYQVELHRKLHDQEVDARAIKLAFQSLRGKIRNHDSLLISFNGHGKVINHRLHLLFANDLEETSENWYPVSNLLAELHAFDSAKDISILLNSCYAGNIFAQPDTLPIAAHGSSQPKSRRIFASGTPNQLTTDSTLDNSNNSPFTAAILEFLKSSNQASLSFSEIVTYTKVKFNRMNLGLQPMDGPFAGHQGGELYLYLKDTELLQWQESQEKDTIESYEAFLRKFEQTGSEAVEKAKRRRDALIREQDQWKATLDDLDQKLLLYIEQIQIDKPRYLSMVMTLQEEVNSMREEVTAVQRAENSWQRIRSSREIRDYQHYISSFPSSKFASQAKLIIRHLKKKKESKETWLLAKSKKGSPQTKRAFLSDFIFHQKDSPYLHEALRQKKDIDLWIEVLEEEDPVKRRANAKKYLDELSSGAYRRKAEEELANVELEVWIRERLEDLKRADTASEIAEIYAIRDEIDSFKSKKKEAVYEVYFSANKLIEAYEEEREDLFEKAIDADSARLFREFIKKYEDTELAAEMKKRFEDKDSQMFRLAEESRDLMDFERYLMEFEEHGGRYEADCRDRIRELEYYRRLQSKDGFLDYIRAYEYQSGLMMEEAKERVADFERQERKAELLQEIRASRSVDLCTAFLSEFEEEDEKRTIVETILSELLQEEEARQLYQSIMTQKKAEEEPLQDIMAYLAKYPEGEHIQEVKAMEQRILNRQKAEEALVEARAAGPEALLVYKERHDYNHQEADEHLLYNSIKESQDIAKCQKYLDKYGNDGLYANQVQEHIEFYQAKDRGNIEEVMTYLERYGGIGVHLEEAKSLYHQLLLQEQEKEGFEEAKEVGTIEGFENYLRQPYKRPPENEKYVRERIKKLKRKAGDRKLYEEAIVQDTENLYLAYLNKYGREGDFYRDVTKRLQQKTSGLAVPELDIAKKVDKLFKSWQIVFIAVVIIIITLVLLLILNLVNA